MESAPESLKRDPDKTFILNYSPIFAGLSPAEKDLISQKSKVFEYKKGDIIYKQHDLPDAFYCLISGRVRIFVYPPHAKKKENLEYLNCGKYFGIISLLTGEAHSVNAEATNDSKVLRIAKEDFHALLEKIPKLAVDLSRTLSRRLRKRDTTEKMIFESSIISIFSTDSNSVRTLYAVNLSLSLRKETHKNTVLVDVNDQAHEVCRVLEPPEEGACPVDKYPKIKLNTSLPSDEMIKNAIFHDGPSGLGIINVIHDINDVVYPAGLNALLTYLTGHYHYVIVNLPSIVDTVVFQTLNQSDIVHIVTDCDTGHLKITRNLISDLFEKVNYPQEKINVIINTRKEGERLPYEEAAKILNYSIYATLPLLEEKLTVHAGRIVISHPDEEYARIIRRIARELGDVRVGLALSGGAAFGLAHIGVIKALEKEGVFIDAVAGSSMGAFIGALWAIGLNGKQLEEITAIFNNNKKRVFRLLMDFCFPKMAFAKGRNIRIFLEKYLGDKTFKDIKFPFKVVACNLSTREQYVYESGKLIDAVMASIAIPGVFAPTRIDGDLIVDGGIIEPVPIGTLVRSGIKKIIAVNVLPSPHDIARTYELNLEKMEEEKKQAEAAGFWGKFKYRLFAWLNKAFFPNIFDVIVNSIQTTEYVIAEADCQKADVVIRPVTAGVDWYEFYKAESLVKRGEEEAYNCLHTIKSLVYE